MNEAPRLMMVALASALALGTLAGARPAVADDAAVFWAMAAWHEPPVDGCSTSAFADVSAARGVSSDLEDPGRTGEAYLLLSLEIIPTGCDAGTLAGIAEFYSGGIPVAAGSACASGDAKGTFVRTGAVLDMRITATMHDASCVTGTTEGAAYDVPIRAHVALTPETPLGTGVMHYGPTASAIP